MKYNLYLEDVSVEAVFNKLGGVGGAKRFLADELMLVETLKPESQLEPAFFLVYVDRSVKPTYPDWFKKLEHPELEYSGPTEYNLCGVQKWLHND